VGIYSHKTSGLNAAYVNMACLYSVIRHNLQHVSGKSAGSMLVERMLSGIALHSK